MAFVTYFEKKVNFGDLSNEKISEYIIKAYLMAMSLEIRPLAVLYPPPYFFRPIQSANAVGMSIPLPVTTESGDRERSPIIKHFFVWGGGITPPGV